MRHRAWGLLVVVLAAVFVAVNLAAPFNAFHLDLYLAGTPPKFVATVVKAGRSDARAALWLDNVFVLSWLFIAPRLLRAGLVRWAPERRRSFGVWVATPTMAVGAAVLDLVENVFSLAMVGKVRPPTGLVLAVTTIAWTKWILYGVSIVGLVALVVGPLTAPVVRPFMRRLFAPFDRLAGPPARGAARPSAGAERAAPLADEEDVHDDDAGRGPSIGICVSGGGISAASVALGALRRLDAPRDDGPSIFLRAAWLVAVSGGAYTAGGWAIHRAIRGDERRRGSDGTFDAGQPWAQTVRARRRFLDNGSLSIVGGVANLVARSVLVLGAIVAALHVVATFAGRVVRSHVIHRDFPYVEGTTDVRLNLRDLVPLRLVLPGSVMLAAAGVLALVAYSRSSTEQRSRLTAPATGFAVAGAGLWIALVVAPAGIVYGRRGLHELPIGAGADAAAALLAAVAVFAVGALLMSAKDAPVKAPWLRATRTVLGLLFLLYAGKVADSLAYDYQTGWTSWPLPGTDERLAVWVVAVIWLVVAECVPPHHRSLWGLYRKRAAATFALEPGAGAPLDPLPLADEPAWSDHGTHPGPELVVATTARATGDTFCGMPAYGFTFRPERVTLHDRTDGTSAVIGTASYPVGTWWDGFPRAWVVTHSMVLGGAVLAPVMRRAALDRACAAPLVALDLRLGAWVPNPRFAHWFADPSTSPRVHLGYLAKELFGSYRPGRDAFVYVDDGGHRENLGLVELLRERPDVVCCVDATIEQPGSFESLGDAINLALVELGVDIDIDLAALRARGGLPLDCAAEGVIRYPSSMGGGHGRLLYGRYQLSETSPSELLQYGAADARFPDYPASEQFLAQAEFDQLVALGEHVGDRIVRLFDGVNP
ncbi:MAG: hypothetical protein AB7L17_11895 [Ilumatobacteraceae bacterium]